VACCLRILIDQAAEDRPSLHPTGIEIARVCSRRVWWLLAERPMWAVIVVVADVLVQQHAQMPFANDQGPVGALLTSAR
jgi:hypothetical protein